MLFVDNDLHGICYLEQEKEEGGGSHPLQRLRADMAAEGEPGYVLHSVTSLSIYSVSRTLTTIYIKRHSVAMTASLLNKSIC